MCDAKRINNKKERKKKKKKKKVKTPKKENFKKMKKNERNHVYFILCTYSFLFSKNDKINNLKKEENERKE